VENPVVDGLAERLVVSGGQTQREDERSNRLESQAEGGHPEQHASHVAESKRLRLGLSGQTRAQTQTA
jgi:hypothetical protein